MLRVLRSLEKGILLRVGKFVRVVEPGTVWLLPFVDELVVVDLREKVLTVKAGPFLTRDRVKVFAVVEVFYEVFDAYKSHYEVQNLAKAVEAMTQQLLRDMVAERTIEVAWKEREILNARLCERLNDATAASGTRVTRADVLEISLERADAEGDNSQHEVMHES